VGTHFDNAKTLVDAAKFEEAKQQLDEARQLWPTCDELTEMEDTVTSTAKQYHAHIDKARKKLKRKEYSDALVESELATRQCPLSDCIVRNLLDRTEATRLLVKRFRSAKLFLSGF
jgi:thioredoxin-like negative regulator of GroEL